MNGAPHLLMSMFKFPEPMTVENGLCRCKHGKDLESDGPEWTLCPVITVFIRRKRKRDVRTEAEMAVRKA